MRRLALLVPLAMALAGCDLTTWSHQMVRARRASLAGDAAGARAAWTTAMDAADRMDSPRRRCRALLALAELAHQAGDPATAAAHLERAVLLVERLYGDEARELLQVLPRLAARTLEVGDLGRSEAVHRRWVAVVEAHPAHYTGRRAPPRVALAHVLRIQGKLPAALEKYESALSWMRDEPGTTRPEAAAVQLALSQLELERGAVGAALELAVRAADRIPGAAEPLPEVRAAIAQAEATALLRLGEVPLAQVEAARERARTLVAGTSAEAAVLARDRRLEVRLAALRGNLEAARELAEEGYTAALARDPPDPDEDREATLELAGLLARTGPLDRAEALYRQVLEDTAVRRGERHPIGARVRLALTRIALLRGRGKEAAAELARAEEDLELRWGTDFTRRVVLPTRARVEAAQGDGEAALRSAREAARRWRALKKGDTEALADVLVVLAQAHRAAGQPEEALKYAEQATRGLRRRFGEEHPAPLEALVEVARAAAAAGRTPRAREAITRALELAEAFLDPTHPWRQQVPALATELGL